MTVDAAAVERWARALGAWSGYSLSVPGNKPPRWTGLSMHIDTGAGIVIRLWDKRGESWAERERHRVDPLTAAIILLGHARGLRVDVGPCRMCGGAGEVETGVEHNGMRETLQCPECSEPCERCKGSGDVPGEPATWENPWGDAPDSCPDCLGYGILAKPGGRHTLTWEAAIIAAMPRKLDETDRDFLFGTTRPLPDRVALGGSGEMISTTHRPGDATTREALRVMAHTIAGPEHVAIVGDWCAAHERNTAANFPGQPSGETGELLAAWLRGGLGGFERELAKAIEAELGRRAA